MELSLDNVDIKFYCFKYLKSEVINQIPKKTLIGACCCLIMNERRANQIAESLQRADTVGAALRETVFKSTVAALSAASELMVRVRGCLGG